MSRPSPEEIEDFLRETYDRDADYQMEETDMERDLSDLLREHVESNLGECDCELCTRVIVPAEAVDEPDPFADEEEEETE